MGCVPPCVRVLLLLLLLPGIHEIVLLGGRSCVLLMAVHLLTSKHNVMADLEQLSHADREPVKLVVEVKGVTKPEQAAAAAANLLLNAADVSAAWNHENGCSCRENLMLR